MNRALAILLITAPQVVSAGDTRYFSVGPIGAGEIGNRILIYFGDHVVRTPIPATIEFLYIIVAVITALIAIAALRISSTFSKRNQK